MTTITNPIADCTTFMKACGQTTDEINLKQLSLYIGLQLEEMAEKLHAIFGPNGVSDRLDALSLDFKRDNFSMTLQSLKPDQLREMVDADFDIAWVTLCATLSTGADCNAAWAEGARSNLAKIGPDGEVIKDPQTGKVQKPAGWTPPDFGVAFALS